MQFRIYSSHGTFTARLQLSVNRLLQNNLMYAYGKLHAVKEVVQIRSGITLALSSKGEACSIIIQHLPGPPRNLFKNPRSQVAALNSIMIRIQHHEDERE